MKLSVNASFEHLFCFATKLKMSNFCCLWNNPFGIFLSKWHRKNKKMKQQFVQKKRKMTCIHLHFYTFFLNSNLLFFLLSVIGVLKPVPACIGPWTGCHFISSIPLIVTNKHKKLCLAVSSGMYSMSQKTHCTFELKTRENHNCIYWSLHREAWRKV